MSLSYKILQTGISTPACASSVLLRGQQVLQDKGNQGFVAAQLWFPAPFWFLRQD